MVKNFYRIVKFELIKKCLLFTILMASIAIDNRQFLAKNFLRIHFTVNDNSESIKKKAIRKKRRIKTKSEKKKTKTNKFFLFFKQRLLYPLFFFWGGGRGLTK